MAAPTFVSASTGVVVTTTGATAVACDAAGRAVGDLVVLQILIDGTLSSESLSAITGISNLAGTAGALTSAGFTYGVGSPSAAYQRIYFGRLTSTTASASVTSAAGDDLYCRWYVFRDVNAGTTLAAVVENSTAGTIASGVGLGTAIADVGVTTLGADRLALQFVAVDDDNPLGDFTGMTGGTWAEAVAEFASATGTDGAIQLQTATIASAGTINGGSFTMAASDNWGVVGFALIPVAAAVDPMPFILMGRYAP